MVLVDKQEKKPRKPLTLEQRVIALKLLSSGMSTMKTAASMGVGRSQIQQIIKRREEIMSDWLSKSVNPHRKRRNRKTGNEEINMMCLKWYEDAVTSGYTVTGPLLQQKALDLAVQLGIPSFKASNGWLESFRRRHMIPTTTGHAFKNDKAHGSSKIFKIEGERHSESNSKKKLKPGACDENDMKKVAEGVESHDKSNATKFENDTQFEEVIKLDEDSYIKEQVRQAISELDMLQGNCDQTSNETNQDNLHKMGDNLVDSVDTAGNWDQTSNETNQDDLPSMVDNLVDSVDRASNWDQTFNRTNQDHLPSMVDHLVDSVDRAGNWDQTSNEMNQDNLPSMVDNLVDSDDGAEIIIQPHALNEMEISEANSDLTESISSQTQNLFDV